VVEGAAYEKGDLRALDVTVTGDSPSVDMVVSSVINQIGEEIKTRGAGVALLKDGDEPQDGRLYLQVKKGTKGTRVTAFAPKATARRVATKYTEVGDCMFSSFIYRHGNEDGVFRDALGDMRTARGTPKPNSRSLENALAKVLPYFQMAKEAGISPTVFADEI